MTRDHAALVDRLAPHLQARRDVELPGLWRGGSRKMAAYEDLAQVVEHVAVLIVAGAPPSYALRSVAAQGEGPVVEHLRVALDGDRPVHDAVVTWANGLGSHDLVLLAADLHSSFGIDEWAGVVDAHAGRLRERADNARLRTLRWQAVGTWLAGAVATGVTLAALVA